MARVPRGGSPAGSPALSATPTGEGVGKVCAEVGYAGDERKVQCGWGARSFCALPGIGAPPEESGRPALGAPRSPTALLPTQFSGRALQRNWRPPRAPLHQVAPVPRRGPLSQPDPCLRRQPAGPRRWRRDGAHGARR